MTPTEAPKSAGRIHGLDAARALAVIAMVFGHTMHGTLSEAAMQVGWVQRYWLVRSFTAPVFLFLSGWVVFLVVTRKGLQGREVLRGYLPRVALLFAIGYGLRFPIFDLWGLWRLDPVLLRYWATFDALHCIAASMLALLLVCAAFPKRLHRELALLGLLGLVAIAGAPVWSTFSRPGTPSLLAQTLGGGESFFPLLPWSAYFFSGALIGSWVMRQPLSRLALVGVGLLGAAVAAIASFEIALWDLPVTEPRRIVGVVGVVLTVVSAALLLPARVGRLLAPIGRASLWVYVLHLPVVYGWGDIAGLSIRIGPTLSATEAPLLAAAMVVGSVTVALLARRLYGRWKRPAKVTPLRETRQYERAA